MNFTWRLVRQEPVTHSNTSPPSRTKTSDPDIAHFDPIVHSSQLHLYICRTHQQVVINLVVHLRSYHKELSSLQRRQIIARHQNEVVVQMRDTQFPAIPIAPITELRPPIVAQRCTWSECTFICRSEAHMRQHARRQHQWRKVHRQAQPWEPTLAQTLGVPGRSGVYFRVQEQKKSDTPAEIVPHGHEVPGTHDGDSDPEDVDEVRRLLLVQDDMPALDTKIDHDHDSNWLRAYGWPKWFQGKSLTVITSATVTPVVSPTTDYALGPWHTHLCVSPVEDEQCLRRIIAATNSVLQRCEETVRETPRLFRGWLRSWRPSFLPIPFDLLTRESSRQRYHSYWRKFVCYIFRGQRVCQQLKERTRDIFGFELSVLQQQSKIPRSRGKQVSTTGNLRSAVDTQTVVVFLRDYY